MKKAFFLSVLLALPRAFAADQPELKEGLWAVKFRSVENPGNKKDEASYKLCRNHAYDKEARLLAKSVPGCKILSESFAGGIYSIASQCVVEKLTIDGKGSVVFQGDTATHSEMTTTYTPSMNGVTDSTTVSDETYEGACPAGMKPGDRIMPDGTIAHMN